MARSKPKYSLILLGRFIPRVEHLINKRATIKELLAEAYLIGVEDGAKTCIELQSKEPPHDNANS